MRNTVLNPSTLTRYALLLACLAGHAQAFDGTTQVIVGMGYSTSQATTGPFDNKRIVAARDDATAFVASDGQIRGAQLESALMWLHRHSSSLRASDLELAQAILVQ